MKKLMLLITITLGIWSQASADLGNCVVYKAKFYLKNGQVFKGCLEYSGYEEAAWLGEDGLNQYCSDKGMLELIKKIQREGDFWNWEDGGTQGPDDFGKVAIYKEIKYLQPRPRKSQPTDTPYACSLGFADADHIFFLDSSEIAKIVFWEASYSDRWWLTTELIVGPNDMKRTVAEASYWNRITVDLESGEDSLTFHPNPMWGVELINYNANNNVAELKRLANLKLKTLTDWRRLEATVIKKYGIDNSGEDQYSLSRKIEEGRERYLQDLREWFWQRGILMVQIWGAC